MNTPKPGMLYRTKQVEKQYHKTITFVYLGEADLNSCSVYVLYRHNPEFVGMVAYVPKAFETVYEPITGDNEKDQPE